MIGTALASKRKRPYRTPSGQPSRSRTGLEREYPPAQVKRLRDAAMSGLRDPEWGTELGRLFLESNITADQYAAGKWWNERAAAYFRAIGAPSPDPKAVSLEVGLGASPADPDSEKGQDERKRDVRSTETFFAAHAVLIQCGKRCESAVRNLCERNEGPCGHEEFMLVLTGLQKIAEHRGLTRNGKSVSAR